MTRLVLLAGASGSGKSRLALHTHATAFRLDDFYFDADEPGLPRVDGLIDWDDARTWDAGSAASALRTLLAAGETVVPRYSISQSRAIGRRTVRLGVRPCVVAEGIFAIEFASTLRAQGIPFEALYLDRPRTVVAGLRLRRDLIKHRKPVPVLLRRGFHLWRTQPALRARALAAGFEPVTMRDGLERLS